MLQTVKQEVEAEDSDGEEAEDQGLVDEMVRFHRLPCCTLVSQPLTGSVDRLWQSCCCCTLMQSPTQCFAAGCVTPCTAVCMLRLPVLQRSHCWSDMAAMPCHRKRLVPTTAVYSSADTQDMQSCRRMRLQRETKMLRRLPPRQLTPIARGSRQSPRLRRTTTLRVGSFATAGPCLPCSGDVTCKMRLACCLVHRLMLTPSGTCSDALPLLCTSIPQLLWCRGRHRRLCQAAAGHHRAQPQAHDGAGPACPGCPGTTPCIHAHTHVQVQPVCSLRAATVDVVVLLLHIACVQHAQP